MDFSIIIYLHFIFYFIRLLNIPHSFILLRNSLFLLFIMETFIIKIHIIIIYVHDLIYFMLVLLYILHILFNIQYN